MSDLVAAAARALEDEGGAPGSDLHSWRCQYPETYGPCDCTAETAKAVIAAVAPLIRAQVAAEVRAVTAFDVRNCCPHGSGMMHTPCTSCVVRFIGDRVSHA